MPRHANNRGVLTTTLFAHRAFDLACNASASCALRECEEWQEDPWPEERLGKPMTTSC